MQRCIHLYQTRSMERKFRKLQMKDLDKPRSLESSRCRFILLSEKNVIVFCKYEELFGMYKNCVNFVTLNAMLWMRQEIMKPLGSYISSFSDNHFVWEEQFQTRYELNDDNCEIWINSLNFTTIGIKNEIIEARRIILYAATSVPSTATDVILHIGYYLDIPGGEKVSFTYMLSWAYMRRRGGVDYQWACSSLTPRELSQTPY